MNKTFRKALIIAALLYLPVMASAVASITSLTMTPPNPTFGDAVTVVINYCASAYNKNAFALAISTNPTLVDASKSGLGQVFVVSKAGIDVATSKPALTPGGPIEWVSNTGWGWYAGPAQCLDCAGGNGWATTETYVVHIPSADNFPGCNNTNLYLHAGFKDNNMNETDWVGLAACETESLSWSIPLFTPAFELQKSAEGVIQSVGDLVLFSIDYKYQNGSLVISDNIPGGGALELVSVGPQSITGGSVVTPGAGATSGTVTWTLPNRTGVKGNAEGTVFMLLRVKTALTAGTVITNTASGTMGGVGTKTSTVSVTAGAAMLTINKSQSDNILHSGDYQTYYLEYEVNGLKLQAYRPIDDLALGTYSAAPPAGFKFAPEGGTNGTWYVEDPCSTGDRVIRGDSGTSQYPALLLDGPDSTFCDGGIVQTDAYIGYGSGTYEGSDALVVIRNNGLTGAASKAYGVLLSVDDAPGTAGTFVKMQKTAGGATTWPTGSATPHILASKWYRVKVTVATGLPYTFNVLH